MKIFIIITLLLSLPSVVFSENDNRSDSGNKTERTSIRRGNKEFEAKNYVSAEVDYRKALEASPSSVTANFNLGDALYKQEKYADAAEEFKKVAVSESDPKKASEAWYNLGNSYLMDKKVAESIEAYKNALRQNPKDEDARYNLRMAQLMLQQQQQQEQQQQENKKEQQQQQQQQQQNQQQNKEDKKEEQQQQQETKMSQENAQQILDAMQQDERNTQEKVRKALMEQRERRKTDKEW